MIDRNTILPFHFYTYNKPFTGSLNGKRYRIIRNQTDGSARDLDEFTVSIWPEPYAYDKTDAELIREQTFPFSEEGYEAVIAYLNEHLVSE